MSGASNLHSHRIFRAATHTRSWGVLVCVADVDLAPRLMRPARSGGWRCWQADRENTKRIINNIF
jgi:hypothetical protein